MTAHAASILKNILKESFSNFTTIFQPNLSSLPKSIAKFTIETKYQWPQHKWIFQDLTLKA